MLGYYGSSKIEGTRQLISTNIYSELRWYFMGDPCTFCSITGLLNFYHDDTEWPRSSFTRHHLVVCPRCGWWLKNEKHISEHQSDKEQIVTQLDGEFTYLSLLSEFDCCDDSVPLDLVRSHIAMQWSNIKHLHPRKVEEVAASIFSDFFGCEVRLTAYSKDGGIDMYSVIGNSPWAFQIKRTGAAAEGVEKVREFLGAMIENGIPNGIFITTADRFTKGAIAVTNSRHVYRKGIQLKLVDGSSFADMFNLHYFAKKPPWGECWPGPLDRIADDISEYRVHSDVT